jgi:hypothetical protein
MSNKVQYAHSETKLEKEPQTTNNKKFTKMAHESHTLRFYC